MRLGTGLHINRRRRLGVSTPAKPAVPIWSAALSGGGVASLLLSGDSTSNGNGGTNPPQTGLAGLLKAWIPANLGLACRYGAQLPTHYNSCWTFGAGWSDVVGKGLDIYALGNNPSGALTFTNLTTDSVDSFRVYYIQNAGNGTITATATGGAPVVQSTSGASARLYIDVPCASAGTARSVAITATGAVWIVAVKPRLTGFSGVEINLAGSPGRRLGSAVASADLHLWYQTVGCHLMMASWGINDAGSGFTSTQFGGYMDTLTSRVKAFADIIWQTMPPSQDNTRRGLEASYIPEYQRVCTANNFRLGDYFGFKGGNYDAAKMNADGVHPNDAGYVEWANEYTAEIAP